MRTLNKNLKSGKAFLIYFVELEFDLLGLALWMVMVLQETYEFYIIFESHLLVRADVCWLCEVGSARVDVVDC